MTNANTQHAKKIYVIYTGGTIGMVATANGYIPQSGYLLNKIKHIQEFYHNAVPEFVIDEHHPLIDSANVQPQDWINLAKKITHHYHQYDGFVILHGTDTLAYTASALSFILDGLNKPVICTGAQIPISAIRSDAADNILHSLILAADQRIKEVCIYFNKQLLRGNRTVKVNSFAMNAFQSPNYPLLGEIGIDIILDEEKLLTTNLAYDSPVVIESTHQPKIAMINVFPGMDINILEKIMQPPLQAAILKTYGQGNAMDSPRLLKVLTAAVNRGVIIINCSQCLQGYVKMNAYKTGSHLLEAGVLSGFDMTDEATLTKLFYLLSTGLSTVDIKENMRCNLRGEVTIVPGGKT